MIFGSPHWQFSIRSLFAHETCISRSCLKLRAYRLFTVESCGRRGLGPSARQLAQLRHTRVGTGSCSLGLVVQVCASHRRQSAGFSLPYLGETTGCGRDLSDACKPSLLTRATSRPSARDRFSGVCRAEPQSSQSFFSREESQILAKRRRTPPVARRSRQSRERTERIVHRLGAFAC